MAKLSSKQRRRLPASSFAYPAQRKYPIDTPARARNALSRAAQKNTFGTYAHVKAAVSRKYPSIGRKRTKGTTARRTSRGRSSRGRSRR